MHYIDVFNPTTSCFCMGIKPDPNTKPDRQYFNKLKEGFDCQMKWQKVNTFFFLIKDSADIDLVNALKDLRKYKLGKCIIVGIFCDGFKNNFNEEYKKEYEYISKICDVKIDLRIPFIQEYELKIIKSLVDQCPYGILSYTESGNPIIERIIDYAETTDIRLLLL